MPAVNKRRKQCNPLSETEAAYIAGLIDGEGTISAALHDHVNRNYESPRTYHCVDVYVSISNSHRGVIDWVKELTGMGSIRKAGSRKSHHKPVYAWCIPICSVASLLRQIIPYLKIKRKQAEIVLSIVDQVYPSRLIENDHRIGLVKTVQAMNQRGLPILESN